MYEQQSLLTADLDEIIDATGYNDAQPQEQAQKAPAVKYYPIDEEATHRAHKVMSMRDYPAGRTTNEYRASVDKAAALVECCKAATSPYYHGKLDALLSRYARRLAQWMNDYNRNGAGCPSILVSGGSNFLVKEKQRQNTREDSLWQEYKEIETILRKIKTVGSGPVDLADPHAREMLTDQLQQLQSRLDTGKAMNAYYRKYKALKGLPGMSDKTAVQNDAAVQSAYSWAQKPMPDCKLSSPRGKIKWVEARLAELDARTAQRAQPVGNTKFDGGEVTRNLEADRFQIFFDEKLGEETRTTLKSNGFRWSSRYSAWQRRLTPNAGQAARRALGLD